MATAETTEKKNKDLTNALNQIERAFGKGAIMRMGTDGAKVKIGSISTGALNLDAAIGIGGVPRGRISEIVAPDLSSIGYAYDLSGNLTTMTCQLGKDTTYTYLSEPAHFLDTITDVRGIQVFDAEFDADGRLLSSTDALGGTISQDVDPNAFTG